MLLAADYSQIELRIMAHLSGDETLRAAFAADRDVHEATAAEVFEVELAAVTADQRRTAKMINFGLIYGMSPFGLARNVGIERAAAHPHVERYFQRLSGVRRFMDSTAPGRAKPATSRPCSDGAWPCPISRSKRPQRRPPRRAQRHRAPMQGAAADIISARDDRRRAWCTHPSPARLIAVRDEARVRVRRRPQAGQTVREHMVSAASLSVPLRVDVRVGASWDQAH